MAFVGTLIVALFQGEKPFHGDSAGYWGLAQSFTRNGHFSLMNFENPARGYALPLVVYVLQAIVNGFHWSQSSVVKLFNAALFALIGAVLMPRLAEITWPERRWNLLRRVALTALLIIFWSGDLNYPLSDFPGLALVLLALIAVAKPDKPGWMLTAGAAGGLAVDMRPAYLPLPPTLIVIVALAWFDQRGVQRTSQTRRALCIGLLLVGFVAASLPQSLSSHRHYNTWSFIPGGPAHLTEEQLTNGLLLQRYDTFVVPEDQYPMVYVDETGRGLLAEQPGGVIASTGQYLEVIAGHPIVIAGLMARHVINGLDMRYSTVYIEHLHSGGHLWLRLPGFLLVFLALVRALWPAARRGLGRTLWRYPLALLLCCFTSIFTGIETRYMLPVWLLSYVLVLAPGWPRLIASDAVGLRRFRTPALLAVSYLVFMAVVWHVVSTATARVVG